MAKIDTLFMTKTAEKPYPYSPYKGEPPRGFTTVRGQVFHSVRAGTSYISKGNAMEHLEKATSLLPYQIKRGYSHERKRWETRSRGISFFLLKVFVYLFFDLFFIAKHISIYSTYNTTLNTSSTYNTTLDTYSTYNTMHY